MCLVHIWSSSGCSYECFVFYLLLYELSFSLSWAVGLLSFFISSPRGLLSNFISYTYTSISKSEGSFAYPTPHSLRSVNICTLPCFVTFTLYSWQSRAVGYIFKQTDGFAIIPRNISWWTSIARPRTGLSTSQEVNTHLLKEPMDLVDPRSLDDSLGRCLKKHSGAFPWVHGLLLFLKNTTVFLDNKTCLNIKFLGQTFHPSFVVLLHWPLALGERWAHDSGDLPWHCLSPATSFQRGWAPSFDGLTLSLQGISMFFKSSTGHCAARPALRTRSQHCRKFGDKQRPRDENEWQLEVWCDAMCPYTCSAESFTPWAEGGVGRWRDRRRGERRWTDRSLSSFHSCGNSETSFKTGSVLKILLPPPNTTPDNAWDQNVFLMTLGIWKAFLFSCTFPQFALCLHYSQLSEGLCFDTIASQ